MFYAAELMDLLIDDTRYDLIHTNKQCNHSYQLSTKSKNNIIKVIRTRIQDLFNKMENEIRISSIEKLLRDLVL